MVDGSTVAIFVWLVARTVSSSRCKMEWLQLIIGFLVGTIFGYVVRKLLDILYQRYVEKPPRVHLTTGSRHHVKDGVAVILHIKNIGGSQFPPYFLDLYNRAVGSSVQYFHPVSVSAGLPHQRDEWAYYFDKFKHVPGDQEAVRSQFTKVFNGITHLSRDMTAEEFAMWEFRMILKNSDNVVIFSDAAAGLALATVIRDASMNNGSPGDKWGDVFLINATNDWLRISRHWISALTQRFMPHRRAEHPE